jgi:hypothetical protein
MAEGTARGRRGPRSVARRVARRLGLIKPAGPVWPEPWRPSLANRLRGREQPPIEPMSRAQFASLRRRFRYYKNRAPYMSAAARLVAELIAREDLTSALELGPHLRPLVTGADVLELTERPVPEGARGLIVHNATSAPWPIEDRAYDLFVGLQVFEHLGDAQRTAFAEVCRVARHAIISLPIDWVCKNPADSHHQISNERVLSWFAPRVPDRIVEGNPGPGARLIYVFEHLDREPPPGPREPPPDPRVPPPIERPGSRPPGA